MDSLAISLFSFVGMVLSLMVFSVLVFFPLSRREFSSPNIILGLAYLVQAYILFTSMLLYTGFILYTPHLYQTRIIAFYVSLPIPMLYMRNIVKRRGFVKWDLLFFLPVIITFIDLLPFFFTHFTNKQTLIINEITDLEYVMRAKPGFFLPTAFHFFAITTMFVMFLVYQSRMLLELYRIKADDFWEENGPWVRWLTVYIISQLMLVLPVLTFFWLFSPSFWVGWVTIMYGITASLTASYLMTHPGILYGIKGLIMKTDALENAATNEVVQPTATKSEYLSEGQIQYIKNKLEPFIHERKPYLQKGYSAKDLSMEVGLSNKQLSAYMNQYLGLNFYDYMNQFRVEYLKTGLDKEELRNLTLEAVAEKAGFNNRTSFVQAVKKFTGKTPSEYVNEILQFSVP